MEPKFQTSFIPKNPVIGSPEAHNTPSSVLSSSASLLPTLAGLLFVIALVAYGGLFAYAHVLNSEIAKDSSALTLVESEFDPTTITNLVQASNRIKAAETLLNNHIATSNMFATLEQNLLPQVRFDTFMFTTNSDHTITMSLTGAATSYAVLAEQSALFSAIPSFQNSSFSNLDLSQTGTITMNFQTTVNPSLISYKQALQNQ